MAILDRILKFSGDDEVSSDIVDQSVVLSQQGQEETEVEVILPKSNVFVTQHNVTSTNIIEGSLATVADLSSPEVAEVEVYIPRFIRDVSGRYLAHYRTTSEKLKASVLSAKELGFPTVIKSEGLQTFEYNNTLYYYTQDSPYINPIPTQSIIDVLDTGEAYELEVVRGDRFIFTRTQLGRIYKMFELFKIVEKQDAGSVKLIIGGV